MLDVAIWREGPNEVKHEFYEKPMTSKRVIMAKSAMSKGGKMATLSQEIIRRMENTGRSSSIESRVEIINRYVMKLRRSGYNENDRKELVESGLRGYYRKVEREEKGGEKVNKDARRRRGDKMWRKMIQKTKWYEYKENDEKEDEKGDEGRGEKSRGRKRNIERK